MPLIAADISTGASSSGAQFEMRTRVPDRWNTYYISRSTPNKEGALGVNPCVVVSSDYLNVLPNCVGYACGRFNEIVGSMKYPGFNCNAKNFISRCKQYYPTLQIADRPTLGGIMVYGPGNGAYGDCGHVCVVEAIAHDGKSCQVSESNYGDYGDGYFRFRTIEHTGSSGLSAWDCWGQNFMGCIVNPAVAAGTVYGLADTMGMSSGMGLESSSMWYTGGALSNGQYQSFIAPKLNLGGDSITYVTKYQEVSTTVRRDTLKHTDEDLYESKSTNLLSYPTNVESPFIILKIGDLTFGSYTKEGDINTSRSRVKVTYPNFMDKIDIVKVNGTVNQYTIGMTYQIQADDDPNFLDKVFSSVGYGKVYISYGDWMSPSFIYKEEEAIITKVTSSVDFSGSKISYTLQCTSNSLTLLGGTYNFSARHAKPSDVIFEMLNNSNYGLKEVFYGMTNNTQIRAKNLIATDDRAVDIEAKTSMDALSYLNYLVTCMTANEDNTDSPIKTSTYYMTIHDDLLGEEGLEGPYFTVQKVKADGKTLSIKDTYEIDVGFPSDNMVMSFNIVDDNSWSLLYNYSDNIQNQNYVYWIDDNGEMLTEYSPALTTSTTKFRTTQAQKDWWTNMTQFPVSATVTIKGLVRPAILMTYVRVNAFFYGQRHISSGLYIITKQQDIIDSNGYRTTLSLTRVAGDQDWYETNTETITTKIPYTTYKG